MKKFFAGLAVFGIALMAQANSLPGPVVSVEWLAKNRDRVQVLDVRSDTRSYQRKPASSVDKKSGKLVMEEAGGVIPGSLLIDYSVVRSERMFEGLKTKYLIPEKEELQLRLRESGVRSDKPLVLVPVGMEPADIAEALRLYWTLKVYGEDRVAVLDGGLAGWIAAGLPVSNDEPKKSAAGDWSAKGVRQALVAGTADVQRASTDKTATLIDGREPANFYGITKRPFVNSYGHIAGAKMLPPDAVFRPANGALYFLSKADYTTLVKLAGIDASASAITYCNSGNLASIPWFVMSEMVGNAKTSLYDGSLYLWSRESKPLVGVLK